VDKLVNKYVNNHVHKIMTCTAITASTTICSISYDPLLYGIGILIFIATLTVFILIVKKWQIYSIR